MHPCCWGPFFQSLAAALPFLAIFFVGGKKLFSMIRPLLPGANKQVLTPPSDPQPISVEEKPSCCGGQKIEFSKKS